MDDSDDTRLPPVVVPDGIDWNATTAEYASLLGISRRTPEQEGRYIHLSQLMERKPPPWMTLTEQTAYFEAIDRTEQALLAAMQDDNAAVA